MSFCPIDFEYELNEDQLAAVTAPPGPALVLAGAGSGKTRTLTYRVAWLLLKQRVHPGSILLLTFTNKAAREMTDRVRTLSGDDACPYWSGTFHSIGARILRREGHRIGLEPHFNIIDETDSESLVKQVIQDADPAFLKNKDNPKPRLIRDTISYARNTMRDVAAVWAERNPWDEALSSKIATFAQLYAKRKLAQQVADYDDLLTHWHDILRQYPEVRASYADKFRHILVDEYQDTNLLQSGIIDLIGAHHNIMAVGDDAQCIYTWRGANFENIRSFPERHPGTRIYKIVLNYRSTPQILALANSVLASQPASAGYEKELVAHRASSSKPFVVPLLDTRNQAKFLINRIEGLYHEGYALKDIAVLYRSHFQALDAQLELARSGIPFVITSGVRFFEQAHIRDFVCQLRVVNNPADMSAFERLFGLLPRVGPATVRKILKAADKVVAHAHKQNAAHGEGLFDRKRVPETLIHALTSETVLATLPAEAREDFASLATTLRELEVMMFGELRNQAVAQVKPEEVILRGIEGWYGDYLRHVYTDWSERREDLGALLTFARRFDNMPELLAQLVLLNSETSNRGVEVDTDCVRLTTIHQAKGLEFRAVFVLGCAEEQFPTRHSIESGDIEEERRLFYVAVTRAMDKLYLCYPMINGGRGGSMRLEPSRFLGDLPTQTYDKLNFRGSSRW